MKIGKKIRTFLAATAVGVLAAAVAGCGGGESKSSSAGSAAKKTVTVAHTNYYVPYDFVNDKGESDGYEVAVMKEISKKLPQYEFKFVPTSDDDLLIGVESGKYDIGTKGVWMTEARKQKYIYPKNYIGASIIGLVIRKDMADKVTDMKSFAEYSGKLVPLAPQDARYMVIADYNKENPDKQVVLTPSEAFQIADALTWVMEGRYDAQLEVELSYINNVKKEDAPYHKYDDRLSYVRHRGIPIYPLFNKKNQQLADEFDKAFEELRAEGKITELQQQYFGEDLTQYITK